MELRKTLVGMFVLGSLAVSAVAPVAAHETTFNYTADGGFLVGTESGFPSGGTSDTVVFHNDDDSVCAGPECHGIRWGVGVPDPTVQSGLHLTPAAGVVTTDGPLVDFGSMLHHNSPISSFFTGDVDLGWHLTLTTLGGDLVDVIDLVFNIQVNETLNSPGDVDDEFTYSLVSGPLSDVFTFEGDTYRVFLSGFYNEAGVLTSTFFSPEGGDNTGLVKFTIEHVVPAPGALALLAIGIAAIGASARRRKQAC